MHQQHTDPLTAPQAKRCPQAGQILRFSLRSFCSIDIFSLIPMLSDDEKYMQQNPIMRKSAATFSLLRCFCLEPSALVHR
jgi:hypothetical protein